MGFSNYSTGGPVGEYMGPAELIPAFVSMIQDHPFLSVIVAFLLGALAMFAILVLASEETPGEIDGPALEAEIRRGL